MTNGTLAHCSHKIFDNLEVDIRFQQRQPDFTHGFLDVLFRKPSTTTQLLENSVKFLCQGIEHMVVGLLPGSLPKQNTYVSEFSRALSSEIKG
jgi:hypothetical protein